MMISLPSHICVTRPQWFDTLRPEQNVNLKYLVQTFDIRMSNNLLTLHSLANTYRNHHNNLYLHYKSNPKFKHTKQPVVFHPGTTESKDADHDHTAQHDSLASHTVYDRRHDKGPQEESCHQDGLACAHHICVIADCIPLSNTHEQCDSKSLCCLKWVEEQNR